MCTDAYKQWTNIFNGELLEIWQKERKELQKAAMLLTALQRELKDVQTNLEIELTNIRQQLEHKDLLEQKRDSLSPQSRKKKRLSPNSVNKENEHDLKLDVAVAIPPPNGFTEKESPDLFKNLDINIQRLSPEISVIDLSLSDEDATKIDGSPTIKRHRKHHNRYKLASQVTKSNVNDDPKKILTTPMNRNCNDNLIRTNLFKTPALRSDDDLSVIENTPEAKCQSSDTTSKVRQFMSKKSQKRRNGGNTLTQMFGNCSKKLQICYRTTNEKTEDDIDSDETYFNDVEGSKMGITNMLSYINKEETLKPKEKSPVPVRAVDLTYCDTDMDSSSQEVDEFSKGAIFNEADLTTSNEKQKVIPPEPEPVVRGKARKQLQGWACEKCKDFYAQMKLSPEELKKKMDECSRHRYKYRPIEDTIPGFWDLSIPPEDPI